MILTLTSRDLAPPVGGGAGVPGGRPHRPPRSPASAPSSARPSAPAARDRGGRRRVAPTTPRRGPRRPAPTRGDPARRTGARAPPCARGCWPPAVARSRSPTPTCPTPRDQLLAAARGGRGRLGRGGRQPRHEHTETHGARPAGSARGRRRVINVLTRSCCSVGYRDTQCGLKAFRSDVGRAVFAHTRIDGFAFDVEVFHLVERYRLTLLRGARRGGELQPVDRARRPRRRSGWCATCSGSGGRAAIGSTRPTCPSCRCAPTGSCRARAGAARRAVDRRWPAPTPLGWRPDVWISTPSSRPTTCAARCPTSSTRGWPRRIGAAFARFALDEAPGRAPRRGCWSPATCARRAWTWSRRSPTGVPGPGGRRGRPRPRAPPTCCTSRPARSTRPGAMFTASHNPAQYNGIKFCLSGRPPGRRGQRAGRDQATSPRRPRGRCRPATTGTPHRSSDLLDDFADHVRSFVDVSTPRAAEGGGRHRQRHGWPGGARRVRRRCPFDLEVMYGELDGTFPNHPGRPDPAREPARPAGPGGRGRRRRRPGLRRRRRPGVPRRRAGRRPVGLAPRRRSSPPAILDKHPGETVIHNLICSQGGARGHPRARRHADPHPGRSLVHQAGDGRDRAPSSAASTRRTTTSATTTGPTPASSPRWWCSSRCRRAGQPLSELRKPFERYADVGRDQHPGRRHRRGDRGGGGRTTPTLAQDRLDGLTVDGGDWWFNLRPSNTEPLLRLNLEAADRGRVRPAGRRGQARHGRLTADETPTTTLDPRPARDPRLPRGQGPAAVLRRRGRALQPAAASAATPIRDGIPVMLIDEANTVDDAEHERLMAKAEAEGIEPTFAGADADDRASPVIDRLARHVRRRARPARPDRGRGRRRAVRSRACRRPTASTAVVVLGMGGSGIGGDVAAAIAGPTVPGADGRVEGLRVPRLRRARHPGVRQSRSPATPRRRIDAATAAAGAGARMVVLAAGGAARPPGRRRGARRACRSTHSIPMPRAGIGACRSRCCVVLERLGLRRPACRRQIDAAVAPAPAPARPQSRRPTTSARPWPGASVARCRSSTAAARSARWRRCGGRASSTRTPRWPRSPTGCPSSPTTRSAVGRQRRRHPQVFSLVLLRHDYEHPQVARASADRGDLHRDRRRRVRRRGRGRRPLWPSSSTWCSSVTS